MNHFRRRNSPYAFVAGMAAVGCSLFALRALRVTATADGTTASPADPVAIHVTAANVGDERVEWGRGSSTCQLQLLVRVGGTDYVATDDRACTMDLRPHVLEPGESRTETFHWAGRVVRGEGPGSVELLEPGTYELRGAAGRVADSEPITIELQAGS